MAYIKKINNALAAEKIQDVRESNIELRSIVVRIKDQNIDVVINKEDVGENYYLDEILRSPDISEVIINTLSKEI